MEQCISFLRGKGWRFRQLQAATSGMEDEPRVLHCNRPDLNAKYEYVSNRTSSTKYTWWSFLPGALFEQYRRAAYWYFTAMAVLSLLPFSPYNTVSIWLPLAFVLTLGIVRELWEDLRRGQGDQEVRHALECTCTIGQKNGESVLGEFWATVRCDGPNASLYNFAGLMELPDGQVYPIGPPQILLRDSILQNTGSVYGVVIYTGHDTKVMRNSTPPPSKRSRVDCTLDKLIIAMFAILVALCITTGVTMVIQTKQEGSNAWYLQPGLSNPYFDPKNAATTGIVSSVNGLVLYGYLIPISLYVSLEVVRVLQALVMMVDIQMYDSATDKRFRIRSTSLNEELGQVDTILSDKTGTLTCNQMDFFKCSIAGVSYGKGATEVEASISRLGLSIGERVTQSCRRDVVEHSTTSNIHYRDTDHSVASTSEIEGPTHNPYKEEGFNFYDSRILAGNWVREKGRKEIQFFFRILALCHTAIPDGTPENPASMRYRAESPDEAALVVAAKQFGFYFYNRTPTTIYLRETHEPGAEPVNVKYQILNVLEFSSVRKRMSVIVRFPDGILLLLSKGADSVILERLDPQNQGFVSETIKHLKDYSKVGLRTLLIAYKVIQEHEYQTWQVRFAEAKATLGREREIRTDEVAEEIERGLTIVGGTGVEDKLQAGVPETIHRLACAGLKIWVLTGDKVETAINIGYACRLLRHGMENLIISLESNETFTIKENSERNHLSRDDASKALKDLVARKITDALELVTVSNSNPRMAETGDLEARSGNPNSCRGSQMTKFSPISQVDKFGWAECLKAVDETSPDTQVEYALTIDGQSLVFIMADVDLRDQFLRVCMSCASVLCCRVSPRQKAQVTKLVCKGLEKSRLCLAIGDGANDVGMIQAANVGVGIIGVEGAQAAMTADYAIGQFRFLERLLLVHGHWCYRRVSVMIQYFFYKVSLLGWISFYSNIEAHFSGQPLFNDWYASFYNPVFTALPIMVVAVIDQDVTAAQSLKYPELYRAGQRSELFNIKTSCLWLLNSWYCSMIIFFFPVLMLGPCAFRSDGQVGAHQDFGQAMFTGIILVPNLQVFLSIQYFTWIHHIAIWGSILSWYLFILVFGSLPPKLSTVAYKEFSEVLAPAISYWLLQLLVVIASLLPDFACRSYKWIFQPTNCQIVLELARLQVAADQRPDHHLL
ncbi:putative phospholipid-transporting ATPase 9 isoform X3 [Physcomitrium patens]|uniref:putative phospholipid-transporting ATPase 9 isoform X3 n=1 Tax=Physcomitrium patens TaxID=3218 RepID=UPI003CCDEC78